MLESRFLRIIQAIGSTKMVVAAMIELVGGSSILNAPRQRRTTQKQVDPNFNTIRKFPTPLLPLCR